MEMKMHRDEANMRILFSGCINDGDMQNIKLDRLDYEVVNSPPETMADSLQSLEILFRRWHEQNTEIK